MKFSDKIKYSCNICTLDHITLQPHETIHLFLYVTRLAKWLIFFSWTLQMWLLIKYAISLHSVCSRKRSCFERDEFNSTFVCSASSLHVYCWNSAKQLKFKLHFSKHSTHFLFIIICHSQSLQKVQLGYT